MKQLQIDGYGFTIVKRRNTWKKRRNGNSFPGQVYNTIKLTLQDDVQTKGDIGNV